MESTTITYERVAEVANNMVTNNDEPSVAKVIAVTGGKRQTVMEFLRAWKDKRNQDVQRLASDIGSSKVGQLIASEISIMLDKSNSALLETIERQKLEIEEYTQTIKELEKRNESEISLAKIKSDDAIKVSDEKVRTMSVKLDEALQEKRDAEMLVKEAERKAQTLIEAANSEAEKLVAAANNERDKSQDEAKQLREQIKELTIDEAKRELEKAESERARDQLSETQSKIADLNTLLTQVQTQNESLTIEKDRNYSELQEAKVQANKAMQLQTQLLTKEGQLGEVNSKLSQAEKQVESLNRTITLLEPKKS